MKLSSKKILVLSVLFVIAGAFLTQFLFINECFAEASTPPKAGLDLVAPTEIKGYAQGIQVGGGNLSNLIVMITNYVLGFLGLTAMTAIIYAGVLYVANFGNDEMTSKAKSIIIYVSIGILVILLSYAIVNALVGVTGGSSPGGAGGAGGGSPGRVSLSDHPVTEIDPLFDVESKDFIYPVATTLQQLGDLCPNTPIGLTVSTSGCSINEMISDTDGDGIANVLDTDDDDDGSPDDQDSDKDGDGIDDNRVLDPNASDLCPDTLSYAKFKTTGLEAGKLQIDRTTKEEYLSYIKGECPASRQLAGTCDTYELNTSIGCAEYETRSDIDGDGIVNIEDCDADNDSYLDNRNCVTNFVANPSSVRGVEAQYVIPDSIDDDDDNDGIIDFGANMQPEASELLLRQLANNFASLENFIRITCATLPQTKRVNEFCGYYPPGHANEGDPFGTLVRMLADLSSDLTIVDFDSFNNIYQEFIALAKSFERVQAVIDAPQFQGELPTDGSPFRVNFNALATIDPYQEYCPVVDDNYRWFVNKTIDFSQGFNSVFAAPADGTGVYFDYNFPTGGVYNVQLLVRSACKYNIVNPGAGEGADVDAAIAGLSSALVRVFPPRASLRVSIDSVPVDMNATYQILAGTTVPIAFDLRASSTNRGAFTGLTAYCNDNSRTPESTRILDGNETGWEFTCEYDNPSGRMPVAFEALDAEGQVTGTVTLLFNNVIAVLGVEPGLEGTIETEFNFVSNSIAVGGVPNNFEYLVERIEDNGDVTPLPLPNNNRESIPNYKFNAPGEYDVTLTVSVSGGPTSSDKQHIVIKERDPVSAFRISFPETIMPARALLDGSLSFHPDYTDNSDLIFTWKVDGAQLSLASASAGGAYSYEADPSASTEAEKVFYEFKSVGDHDVILTVSRGDNFSTTSTNIFVETLLGVGFDIDKPGAHVDELVTFTPEGNALGYYWDFGDGETLVGDTQPVVHKYKKQGTYIVKLEVEDGAGNTNSLEKKMRVGIKDAPIAFTQVHVNSTEQDLSSGDCVEVNRIDNVLFDAGKSVSVTGEKSGISYLWEIDDFDEVFRTRSFTRIFKDLTRGGCLDIDLTVIDLTTNAEDQAETIGIEVVNIPPELTDVTFSISEQNLVTPVTVNVSVVGARDIDGRVTRYQWWYYEDGQNQKKLDSRVTDIARTSFVVGPRGIEGTQTTYYFVVEIEDNDGAKTKNVDSVGPSEPLVVTNGPNVAPVAEFVTDRGTVSTDESVTYTSTTRDPLGEFIPSSSYQWDFEGDGEFERGVNGAKVSHKYSVPGVFQPTLRVTKNGLTSQYDMKIRVVPSSADPEAAFIYLQSGAKVKFVSNSTVDSSLEDKTLIYAWDLDTTIDTDGNGIPDDDADSSLISPSYEFDGDRDVFVALKVTDSVGSTDQVVRKIPFLKKEAERGTLGASKIVRLKPSLIVNPPLNELDGRLYLKPPFSDVVFNSKQSSGNIQEYRIDANIFVDSDGDGVADNDIDNKTHKSWQDGSSFKQTYRDTGERIRMKLTLVSVEGQEKSKVIDIIFAEETPILNLEEVINPDDILNFLDTVPVVTFDVSTAFATPNEEVKFDASRTEFPDEKVMEYRWDFDGDGLVDEISFEPTFSHIYTEAAVYEVILEAVSDGGLLGEYSQTIFIRGGLTLPEANFSYDLQDNEVLFSNLSTFDTSIIEELIEYEWKFERLDLAIAKEWETWEQLEELVIAIREFNLAPLRVHNNISLESTEVANGVLSRQVVLGSGDLLVRFPEGITMLDQYAEPFVGDLKLDPENDQLSFFSGIIQWMKAQIIDDFDYGYDDAPSSFDDLGSEASELELEPMMTGELRGAALAEVDGKKIFDSGIAQVLSLSEEIELIYDAVIFDAQLYQVSLDNEPVYLADGVVEENMTIFKINSFGGQYEVQGTLEEGETTEGEALGVSTVKDPVKVFSEAGLYRITLKITDTLGETNEKSELITINQDLQLVEPGTVEPEREITEEPDLGEEPIDTEVVIPDEYVPDDIIPVPEVVGDDTGGVSYFWLVFIFILIGGVGAVVFIVVKTIKQRQEELDIHTDEEGAGAEKLGEEGVVEPEVLEATPKASEEAGEQEKPDETKADEEPVPAAKTKDTSSSDVPSQGSGETGRSDSKDDKKGDDKGGDDKGGGPIPDWLKG